MACVYLCALLIQEVDEVMLKARAVSAAIGYNISFVDEILNAK